MFRSDSAKLGLLAAALLGGCSAKSPAPELAAPAPVFRAERFFLGRTAGEGTLKIVFKDPQAIRVEGRGRVQPDGTLILDQMVWRSDKRPQQRQWRIRQVAPGRYRGRLTDATDLVVGETHGNLLHLSYPMRGGVHAEQWIYLQPDGRTALNRMRITKLGVTVGRLDETIRKLD
jgi:hypothetical protein